MAARRPQHRTAHAVCPNGVTSWDACDLAEKVKLGQCAALIEKTGDPCEKWGIEVVDGRPYCGQHVTSIYLKAAEAVRFAARKADLYRRIETSLAWTALHPSVWDRMPAGWVAGGAGVEPAVTRVTAEGLTTKRPANGIRWRASEGKPLTR